MAEPLARGALEGRTAVVVLNPGAGAGGRRPSVETLVDAFRERGIEPRFVATQGGGATEAAVREAVRSGVALVVAAGGDGTIGSVATALAGSETALGILPFGTRNHFAGDLGIPAGLDAALDVLANGRVAAVDVGDVNGTVFVNNSSLGLYPRMVLERRRQRNLFGRSRGGAFAWAVLVAFRRYSFLEVRIVCEASRAVLHTPFVFIGNNPYELHGLGIGSRPRLDQGRLHVCVPHRTGRAGLLRLGLRALAGALVGGADFSSFESAEVTVAPGRPRVLAAVDGELVPLDCPLRYRIRPKALRVVVPE